MSHEDEIARLRAEMDQGKEGLKQFAGACSTFYEALKQEGFGKTEALRLTAAWLTTVSTPRETGGSTE